MRRQHQGKTAGFFETGTEGIMWVIEVKLGKQKTPNQKKDVWGIDDSGRKGFVDIENGDRLILFDNDDEIFFDGIVERDEKAGWTEYPQNPGHGQPCAFGSFWIRWTQKGYAADDWANFFIKRNGKNKHLNARIIKSS